MNNSEFKTDILVIGAGIVGLAVAREFSAQGFDVIVVERNKFPGTETSSRNSEVIHAGLYYPSDSLKTRLCISGNKKIYEYCNKYNVPFNNCGKLIVSTTVNEDDKLENLYLNGKNNGLENLKFLSRKEILKMEPELNCKNAFFSSTSGVINTHRLIESFISELQSSNSIVAFNSVVNKINIENDSFFTEISGSNDKVLINSKSIINCAGLSSQNVAKKIDGFDLNLIPKQYLAKGTYFTTTKRIPFNRLIYPIPEKQGLGVHYTIDSSGKGKFGPDLEWIDKIDYSVDIEKRTFFFNKIKKFWKNIEKESLNPDYAGIRPKISGPLENPGDFIIQDFSSHEIKGLINLFGIESPGLTCCLSIASEVSSRISHLI